MQDKAYAVAIVVVLGICCLGMYVAVSGYLNSNPSALSSLATPVLQSTQVIVNLPTDTPLPTVTISTKPVVATAAPLPSPLGAFQTITAATTSIVPTAPPVTLRPAASATSPASSIVSCAGFQFCPRGGIPDSNLGPGGNECPRNYVWGLITDANGKGLPNVRIRYKAPTGETAETQSKNLPDPQGKYDVLAPNGTFTIWLADGSGNLISPQFTITVQAYSGAGNCPTRLDFVQQK